MPSPIAHSVTGYAIFKLFKLKSNPSRELRNPLFVWAVFAANAADLDFILQFVSDSTRHRGITHSLLFALCFSLTTAIVTAIFSRSLAKQLFLFTVALYSSHLLLDWLTAGGPGMQLLLPFSSNFFKSHIPLFPAVRHSEGLFYSGHLITATYELLYSVLIVKALNCTIPKLFVRDQAAKDCKLNKTRNFS